MPRFTIKMTFFSVANGGIELQSITFCDLFSGFRSDLERGALLLKQNQGKFSWTAGVRSLCALLLNAALRSRSVDSESQWDLRGSRPSLALTLDYAIAKNTSWLCECFGVDRRGDAIFRRFVERENSELKRPGTMGLRLRKSVLDEMEFTIVVDGVEVVCRESLRCFADCLDRVRLSKEETFNDVSSNWDTNLSIPTLGFEDNYTDVEILNDDGDARVLCSYAVINLSNCVLNSYSHPLWFDETCGDFNVFGYGDKFGQIQVRPGSGPDSVNMITIPFVKRIYPKDRHCYGYGFICERMFSTDLSWQFKVAAETKRVRMRIVDRRSRPLSNVILNAKIAGIQHKMNSKVLTARTDLFGSEISWSRTINPIGILYDTQWAFLTNPQV